MSEARIGISTSDFLILHKNSAECRDLSRGCIAVILGKMARNQESNGITATNSDWRKVFVDCREYDCKQLLLSPELGIAKHATKILEMTKSFEGLDPELASNIKNSKHLSDVVAIHSNLTELQEADGWEEAACNLISELGHHTKLTNGKYLVQLGQSTI